MSVTTELKRVGPFRFLEWYGAGSAGYLIIDSRDGVSSGLFCDFESEQDFEHIMQLPYNDCLAECEAVIAPWRAMQQREGR